MPVSYDKRTVRSWVLYDFANSIYPAVITTAVYPLFYVGVVVNDEGGRGEFWWGLAVSLSALLVAFSSPLLGAIADRSGVRKKFFGFYVAVCLIGVALMTTLQPGMVIAGFLFFVIANVGFESAVVFYNAYLPDIAPPEQLGEVSGKGFGWGYLGSALGLLLVLPFGMQEQYHLIWPTVVAFFILFSIPAFRVLPADGPGQMRVGQAAIHGIRKVKALAAEVWRIPNMRRFLFAYFFFIDGVLTIIAMAGVIAKETFGFTTDGVIILFLIVQFSAMAGALAMAKPTDRLGPKMVLTGVLIMWVAAGIAAYFIQSQMEFYVLAIVAGIGLGTVQSASRAFMASLVPDGREAQMFGFYALCGRSSSVLGPFLFGLAVLWAGGNQRPGFLVLTAFFLIGLILLQRVVDPKAPPKTA
ncbi:MAG: MFS transporter [Gemmatimonadetes bacterium]|nr:MFS transporter [Gemmatimonadota bacterium]MYA11647.1 MFS transporter [Gemmatimonadota bacterium]MYD12881.1 MFS transporter [Gemmatimonadota bacterium]MYE71575.1 MFS transporter [Gemmatimonadota bacterium]MYI64852.1 MFS transporter [Gemmatimonadota bacterium]